MARKNDNKTSKIRQQGRGGDRVDVYEKVTVQVVACLEKGVMSISIAVKPACDCCCKWFMASCCDFGLNLALIGFQKFIGALLEKTMFNDLAILA